MIDYSPLWHTMKKKNFSQYRLLKAGIDNKTLDALKKNKNITLLTLEKLCIILECRPNDIVKFTKYHTDPALPQFKNKIVSVKITASSSSPSPKTCFVKKLW